MVFKKAFYMLVGSRHWFRNNEQFLAVCCNSFIFDSVKQNKTSVTVTLLQGYLKSVRIDLFLSVNHLKVWAF